MVDMPSLATRRQASLAKMRVETLGNRKSGQFFPGDRVYIQHIKTGVFNIEGTVIVPRVNDENPRSYYLLVNSTQNTLLRNRCFIKLIPSQMEVIPSYPPDR